MWSLRQVCTHPVICSGVPILLHPQASAEVPRSTISGLQATSLPAMDVRLVDLGPTDSGSLQLKDSVGNSPEDPQVRLASALAELSDLKARYMQLEKSADVDHKPVEHTREAIQRERLAAERAAANLEAARSALDQQTQSFRALGAAHKYVCDEYLAMQKKVLQQGKAYDHLQDELRASKRTILDERARHLNELEVRRPHVAPACLTSFLRSVLPGSRCVANLLAVGCS